MTCGAVKHINESAVSKTLTLDSSVKLSDWFRVEIERSLEGSAFLAVGSAALRFNARLANSSVISRISDIEEQRDGDDELFPAKTGKELKLKRVRN